MTQRATQPGLPAQLHLYKHLHAHSTLKGRPPIARLTDVLGIASRDKPLKSCAKMRRRQTCRAGGNRKDAAMWMRPGRGATTPHR
jgi:hypothetical protein